MKFKARYLQMFVLYFWGECNVVCPSFRLPKGGIETGGNSK